MNEILNRVACAWRVLFSSRVLVLERRYSRERNQDQVTLWGTLHDKVEQVQLLSRMSASVYSELTEEEKKKCATL